MRTFAILDNKMQQNAIKDTQLWDDFRKGNAASFEKVYTMCAPALSAYGMRLCGDAELVGDTVQDLFVKLIMKHSSLGATDNICAYLMVSFRNLLCDKLRKHGGVPLDEAQFAIPDESALFDEVTEQTEKEKRLWRTVSSLSGRQREIIYLYYVKGYSHQQIADIMGINYQSSKNLLHRTIEGIRKAFFIIFLSTVYVLIRL